jgi:hypothetical protein
MASRVWSIWVKWEGSMEQTLSAGQHLAAGESTIAEARARGGTNGTASILDVVVLHDLPRLGRCWVLGSDDLHQHFGSKMPPRKGIEAGREAFVAKLERGQAVAVIAYARGLPSAVLFAGRTDG